MLKIFVLVINLMFTFDIHIRICQNRCNFILSNNFEFATFHMQNVSFQQGTDLINAEFVFA